MYLTYSAATSVGHVKSYTFTHCCCRALNVFPSYLCLTDFSISLTRLSLAIASSGKSLLPSPDGSDYSSAIPYTLPFSACKTGVMEWVLYLFIFFFDVFFFLKNKWIYDVNYEDRDLSWCVPCFIASP